MQANTIIVRKLKKRFVSIIVLNWNGKEFIRKCLESIKRFSPSKLFEVIVIDNGSKDGSVQMLQEMKKNGFLQKLILNPENLGFSKGNNQGFEIADGEFFFMLKKSQEQIRLRLLFSVMILIMILFLQKTFIGKQH